MIKSHILILFLSLLIQTAHASPGRLSVFVEGLYWYTSEVSDWAFTLEQSGNSLETKYQSFHFDWAPGARAGLEYSLDNSKFDIQSWYTHFQSEASGKASGSVTPGFLAARLSLLEPFSSGKAKLNVYYDTIDCDLGLDLCMNRCLQLRPAIGIKGGWIQQKIRSKWERLILENLITASENLTQNFSGVGPKGAIGATWCLNNCGLSLIGLFDISYLWGHWSIRDEYIDNLLTAISLKTNPRKYGSLVLHSFIGAEWCYALQCTHIIMRLGYEFENWFNQLQIFTDVSGSQNNNLILQGVTLRLSCEF